MELRSVQSASQISILQTADIRLDLDEQRAQKSALFADIDGNLVQNERAQQQTEESRERNDKRENKVNDFSSLEETLRDDIRDLFNEKNVALKFSLDNETKQLILSLIDSNSNEIIRQIPSELALKILKFFNAKLDSGQVTDAKV
ncbi:MAG: flagellar protein FlaG [Candidatus Kapabacteria bacterium]|nr:flagellar protein FlaG [Candidatus Kapabacteria bacterium]